MRFLSLWENDGEIILVRDVQGNFLLPNKKVQYYCDMEPFFISNEMIKNFNSPDLMYRIFVDDDQQTFGALVKELLRVIENYSGNLLFVSASDSVERKLKIVQIALSHRCCVRILEVDYPISMLSPTFCVDGFIHYSDLICRRKTNFADMKVYKIATNRAVKSSMYQFINSVLSAYMKHNELFFPDSKDENTLLSSEYDLRNNAFFHSEVLPFTLDNDKKYQKARYDYADSRSQNPRFGIVRQLRKIKNDQTIPDCLVTVQADVADLRFSSQWANNTVCQGSAFNDIENAQLAALGEAYERYCVNIIDKKSLIIGSWNELALKGINAVKPSDFVLFSAEQLAMSSRFVLFDENTVTTWTKGVTFSGEEIYVPISMVYVNYNWLNSDNQEIFPLPTINSIPYVGISAGPTRNFACINALQEIIERHATMCWWHNPAFDVRTNISCYPKVSKIVKAFENCGNTVSIVGISNRFRIPVYAVTLFNKQHEIINTGFACRLSNEAAILKALTEAATLQEGSLDLLQPDGELFKAIDRGELWQQIVKPWIKSRKYMDYYSDHFSTMTDLMQQQQVYLDPRMFPRVKNWLVPSGTTDILYPDKKFDDLTDELKFYINRIRNFKIEPIVVDVTTRDVASLGIHVTRVIAPGLVPNFAVGNIHLGKNVLQSEPVVLGHQNYPTKLNNINFNPLPHC